MNESKERVTKALNHQEPDRVPLFDGFWGEFVENWRRMKKLEKESDITDYYGVDIRVVVANETPWPSKEKTVEQTKDYIISKNGWGQVQRTIPGGKFYEELDVALTEKRDLDKLVFESPALESRYSNLDSLVQAAKQKRYVFCKTGGPYMRTSFLRGTRQFLLDIAEDIIFVKELVSLMTDHLIQIGLNELERWDLYDTGIAIYDDIAFNNGLMFSPKVFEDVFYPALKKMCRAFKGKGAAKIMFHSDGDVSDVVSLLIDAGIDALNPVEPRAGMDVVKLKERYGNKLAYIGGLDNSGTLSRGTKLDIENEVKYCLQAAKGGGLVLGSHSIGPDVSVENYDYLISAVRRYGKYPLDL